MGPRCTYSALPPFLLPASHSVPSFLPSRKLAWAMCIPSLDQLTVFHKCKDRAKDYPTEDVAMARQFFEGHRGWAYPHVNDPASVI